MDRLWILTLDRRAVWPTVVLAIQLNQYVTGLSGLPFDADSGSFLKAGPHPKGQFWLNNLILVDGYRCLANRATAGGGDMENKSMAPSHSHPRVPNIRRLGCKRQHRASGFYWPDAWTRCRTYQSSWYWGGMTSSSLSATTLRSLRLRSDDSVRGLIRDIFAVLKGKF